MFKLNPSITIELTCFIVALFTIRKDNSPLWRSAFFFMIMVCFTEIFAAKWAARTYHNNLFVYNIYTFFEGSFISFGVYQCLKKYTNPKKIISLGLVVFYVTYGIFLVRNGIMVYNSWAGGVLSAIMMLYCCYYYYLILTHEEILDINTSPDFWWITAVLFFYFGSTTGSLFHELFTSITIWGNSLRNQLFSLLNIIFYSLLAYSFICRSRQRKLQS